MKDWFRDNLKLNNKLVGSYDGKKDEYNISLPTTIEAGVSKTASFREDVRGWVSFKSFITKNGNSCANEYYTFKDANLWRHHHDVPGNRNTFYGIHAFTTFNVLLNDGPNSVKSFYTLNYEGSNSKVTLDVLDDQYHNLASKPGWYVDSIVTNKETGDIYEFIEKEGKWFNYIRGTNITHDGYDNIIVGADGDSTFDQAGFAIQGLGALNGLPSVASVLGCTDLTAQNYNPLATLDDGSCIPAVMITGCTHATAVGYNPLANTDDGTCMWPGCVCNPNSYPGGCTNPTFFNNQAQNYMGIGIQDDGSCIAIVLGCTTLGQFGYNPLANTDDGSCTPIVGGCVGQNNIPAQSVINPNPSANTDDGSCQWEFCGESSDASYNSAAAAESNNYAVAGPGYINDAVGCTSGGCMDATAFNYNGGINPLGNIVEWDDGSCIPFTYGCMDGGVDDYTSSFGDGGDGYTAANYDATVNTDDGSCYYITTCYKCGNHSVSGAPGYIETVDINFTSPNVCPGIWMDSSQAISAFGANFNVDDCCILGCTDPLYTEYSPLATCDDGSCVTLVALCEPYTYTVDSVVQPSAPGLTDGTITVTINSPNYLFTGLFGQFAFSYNPSPIPALPFPFNFIYNWSNGNSTVTITLNGIGEVGLFTLSIYDQTNFSNACPMLEEDFTFPSLAVPGCMTMGATNYTGPGSGVIPEATVDDGSCVWVISGDSIIAPGVDTCQMLNYQPACAPGCVFLNMGGTLDQALCDCCNDNNTVPNIEAQGNIYYGCNPPWGC